MLYSALRPLIGYFIQIDMARPGGVYEVAGKLVDLTREFATMRTYDEGGDPLGEETHPICLIVCICKGHDSLSRLKATVCHKLEAAVRDR